MSDERIRVSFVTAALGLGGTEKGVVSFATRLDPERFSPRVITLAEGGPRAEALRQAGVPVLIGCGEETALAKELAGSDVVHVFRHGIAEPLVPAAVRQAGVPVLIESNIFGAHDRSSDEADFACHLLVSMMCLLRYMKGQPPDALVEERHRVLYFPPEAERLRALAPDPRSARSRLGLDPDRPVVTRLGRAADLKWRDLLVDMVPHLLRLVPEAQILFVGATPAKRKRLARLGVLERVRLMEPVSSDEELAALYGASDVVVNASTIGESQGLVIAEAMALGIPVVTCSTPWADNAQVEFVENGRNGWVANHPVEFAEAVADLLGDPGRRTEFGHQARQKIDQVLDPAQLTRQLEALYEHHLRGSRVGWQPSRKEVARFADEYPDRCSASFRPLTPRERAQTMAARIREAMERRIAGARMLTAGIRQRLHVS